MNTINLLRLWLKLPGNTKSLMASRLGYETSTAIALWLSRGQIPKHQESRVLTIIKEKKNVSN